MAENNNEYMLIDAGNNNDGDGLVNYLKRLGVEILDARLISYTELIELGCSIDVGSCKDTVYSWVYSTSYWTGNAYDANNFIFVRTNNTFNYNSSTSKMSFGIRPVIEIDIIHF